jgi:hypothetical protein
MALSDGECTERKGLVFVISKRRALFGPLTCDFSIVEVRNDFANQVTTDQVKTPESGGVTSSCKGLGSSRRNAAWEFQSWLFTACSRGPKLGVNRISILLAPWVGEAPLRRC